MYQGSRLNGINYPPIGGGSTINPTGMNGGGFSSGGFSHKAPVLSTDMRCYFSCPEGFKKDFDLRLHLKVRHKNENENELRRAYQAAEEEIALTSSTASVFQCAICPKKFSNHRTFYDHVGKRAHNMVWLEYKAQYGRCEVESAPFECKICGRVVKYTRASITNHMKMVHSITWPLYLERIRNMREGEKPKELPSIAVFECKICSASVKYIFREKHLKGVHKITQSEYVELFAEEMAKNKNNPYQAMNPVAEALKEEAGYDDPGSFQGGRQNHRNLPLPDFPLPPSQVPNYFSANNNNSLPKPPKSDIEDDTNKMCTSCDVEFESRKKFIEHCTTAHDMNFRTASGNKITSSLVSQKSFIQPPTFKGRFEEDEQPMPTRNGFQNFLQPDPTNYGGSGNSPSSGSEMGNDAIDLPLEDEDDYS